MFERLTSTVLQRALQEYFVMDNSNTADVTNVWSGFVRWNQMELRKEWLNEKIQAKGLPFEVVHGHVNLLTMSIPWSKLKLLSSSKGGGTKSPRNNKNRDASPSVANANAGTIVVVLDGVQLLVRTNYEFDDDALDQARVKSRRKRLLQSSEKTSTSSNTNNTASSTSSSSWRESLRQRIKDGILPQIADNLHLHIRDLHIRLEDTHSSPQRPMAFGIVLESIHLQHSEENNNKPSINDGSDAAAADGTLVEKESQINHFAIYANALDHAEGHGKLSERSVLWNAPKKAVIEILDRSIPRRANSLEATTRLAPQHTYILSPVDASATVQSGSDPSRLVAMNRPVLAIAMHVPAVRLSLQDVHCHAGLALYYKYQDHKYRARYRPFRPRQSVKENPRAWWQYAATAVRHELQQARLHWSWRRFQKRYLERKRYCDLYERKLRSEFVVEAAADDENGHTPAALSTEEDAELMAMEDGVQGDLAVEDIILFRAIVKMRLRDLLQRYLQKQLDLRKRKSSLLTTTSWLHRTFSSFLEGDSAASDEFQRAMDLWEEAKENLGPPLEESASWVAVSVQFIVDEGIFSVYTPLPSTVDQKASNRLQMHFLSFVFDEFRAHGRLLGDFESLRLDTTLQDFYAEEERSDRTKHTVIAREIVDPPSFLPEASPAPFWKFQFLKNSRQTTDFHIGINAEIQQLLITLEPSCEWIKNGKSLLRPFPRISKLKEFWDDVGMNLINTMKTHGRDIFAKAETAVADHKSIDVDMWIDCPVFRIHGEESQWLLFDLGQTRIRTERLAGVAKSKLISTLRDEAVMRMSSLEDSAGENSIAFMRANPMVVDSMRSAQVNESIRSVQMNDMLDGIQFRDEMTALDHLANSPPEVFSGIESFFYDTYIADLKTGSTKIQNDEETVDILDPVEIRTTLRRSIIPRDATLFRYKILFSVGEVLCSLSEKSALDLRGFVLAWDSTLRTKSQDKSENLDVTLYASNIGLLLNASIAGGGDRAGSMGTMHDHTSDFDEDEFFDTMEHESAFSDMESAAAGDNFMAESDSVLDSDGHSLARSVRSRRKRQASVVSDVSSISEGSATKRKGHTDIPYLSAENLARLEENADEDAADDFDDDGHDDEESFQSAVSASKLVSLIQNLEDDIKATETARSRLKEKLGEFRSKGFDGNGDIVHQMKLRNALQLEIERIRAELMAMTATRDDLKARLGATSSRSVVSMSKNANRSVEMASMLLQTRRKRGSVGVEQSLAGNWSRSILQLSGNVESVILRFGFGEERQDAGKSCFWVRLGSTSVVFVTKTSGNKIFLSNESLSAGINKNKNGNETSQHVFVGGNVDDYSADLLSSRYPNFVNPVPVDEKLVRVAITLVKSKSQSETGLSSLLLRVRVAVGDFQVTPCPSYVTAAKEFAQRMKYPHELSGRQQPNLTERREKDLKSPTFYDATISLSSAKILDGHGGRAAAVISDVTLRASGAVTEELYKERAQIDMKWSGLQLLYTGQGNGVQPVEILTKQDAYTPVLRVRARVQKGLSGDAPGWVVGLPLSTAKATKNANGDHEVVRRVHAIVQIEPLVFMLSPDIIEALLLTRQSWRLQSDGERNRTIGRKRIYVARLDLSVRKLSVVSATSIDNLTSEDAVGKRLLLSMALHAAVQSNTKSHGSLMARAKLNDIYFRFVNDSTPFLHPCSVCLLVDRLSPDLPVSHRETPIMNPPDTLAWACEQLPEDFPEFPERTADAGFLVTFLATPLELSVNPKTAAFVFTLTKQFLQSFKNQNRPSSSAYDSQKRTKAKNSEIVLRTNLERFQVSFFEQSNGKLPRSGLPQFILRKDRMMVVVQKQGAGLSIWWRAMELESIDFSSRRGIQSLGRSANSTKKAGGSGSSPSNIISPMLEFHAGFSRESTKIVCTVNVSLRSIQVLLLPSLVRSALSFQRDFSSLHNTSVKQRPMANGSGRDLPREVVEVQIAIVLESLEVLFPTRDVPKFLRDGSSDDIGVVSVRCGADFRTSLDSNDFGTLVTADGLDNPNLGEMKNTIDEFISKRMAQSKAGNVAKTSTELIVRNLQVLRTAMRVPAADPIIFETAGSSSREQRVTNSFCLALRHELAATVLDCEVEEESTSRKLSMSHALEIKSEFIDLLVYIARSDRGINTAIDSTVRPILNLFKNGKNVQTPTDERSRGSLMNVLAMSSMVASFRIEGVQVTCVPGGATRLTESPIIKGTLGRIAAGCGVVGQSAPPGVRLVSSTDLDGISTQSSKEFRHVILGAWLSCEISAYYHNRRLVEWEPFIEPWGFHVRFGADLMRTLRLPAVPTEVDSFSVFDAESSAQTSPAPVTRLAHLSRLIRSPFGAVQDSSGVQSKRGPGMTDADVCVILLHCSIPSIVQSAAFRNQESVNDFRLPPLPSHRTLEWIQNYGYPVPADTAASTAHPALSCQVLDEGALNVNVTGALFDTLLQYLSKNQEKDIAPHLIQNRSGLTLRFQEVLDGDRSIAGERAPKVTLESGKSCPLSLRRSLSQSCDPHKAYISVELGTFDETIDRAGPKPIKGSRSSVLSYRISSKIPVDTVSVSRYPIEWNGDRTAIYNGKRTLENLGWIIVKVRLAGGTKVVSVESPLSLSNTSDSNIFFEMRENDGVSVRWRSYLEKTLPGFSTPVPADLAMAASTKSCKLVLVAVPDNLSEEEKQCVDTTRAYFADKLKLPPPFSKSSLSRGILLETDISVPTVGFSATENSTRHFNVCALRVGSISLEQQGRNQQDSKEMSETPEQRMLVFRSSILFRNHLALPIEVQARSAINGKSSTISQHKTEYLGDETSESSVWENLGRLDCGDFLSWSGAAPQDMLQIRFRFVENSGGPHRQFPRWSSPTEIPPEGTTLLKSTRTRKLSSFSRNTLHDISVTDVEGRRLLVSACLTQGLSSNEDSSQDIEYYLNKLHHSSRVVGLFVPFWIIDQTGMDLQFRSGAVIAGQEKTRSEVPSGPASSTTMGLGELLDDRNMSHLPSRIPFGLRMIGNHGSSFVNVRMGKNRSDAIHESSWSTPIHLPKSGRSTRDTVVVAPGMASPESNPDETCRASFVVRSRIVDAPEHYGGAYGTRLVHMVCKYIVVNSLGHDVEISSGMGGEDVGLVVKADSRPRPLSFISGRIRFRPKEFGWHWSGPFRVTLSRKDVTLSLRHGLKGYNLIASVEFHPGETAGTCVIVLRKASHAPYRIENHSMFPLMYYQRSPFSQSRIAKSSSSRDSQDCVVLPYHSASFAWDEPEDRWRSVGIQFADFGLLPSEISREYLGSFDLERMSPGTEIQLPGEGGLLAKVIAEGPTRILRITGSSSVDFGSHSSPTKGRPKEKHSSPFPSISFQVRLRKGFGLSVVDWTPQELLYLHLQDIRLETELDKGKETTQLSVVYAAINNQLWVTPYPVAVSIGSRSIRRRNRKQKALTCNWSRSTATDDTFDGVTLVGSFEVFSEPIDIRIDGRLASLVVEMGKQMKRIYLAGRHTAAKAKGNSLKSGDFDGDFLNIGEGQADLADELYSGLDSMATSAIAAKLRHNYRPIHLTRNNRKREKANVPGLPFLKSKHKFYIERLRVSVTSITLSWHGFLPVASVLRPAFFFEGLPLYVRPYAASHVYGSLKDLAKGAMSHYLSVRRVIDVAVGAMVRKPFFFPREVVTYLLSSGAGTLRVAERSLLAISHPAVESTSPSPVFESFLLPLAAFSAAVLRTGVNILQGGSSIVRYGSLSPRPTGIQPRSRNPRFFAHTDGNDLLVEYVEGENAGKALLSRVRMGAHLIEGYSFHVDDVFESRLVGGNLQIDNKTRILMATNERLMLLRGQLDGNFCKVLWEATFNDIVHVEHVSVEDVSTFDLLTIWFIRDLHNHTEETTEDITKTVAMGSSGLGMLQPITVFVPRTNAGRLVERIFEGTKKGEVGSRILKDFSRGVHQRLAGSNV